MDNLCAELLRILVSNCLDIATHIHIVWKNTDCEWVFKPDSVVGHSSRQWSHPTMGVG